jgi:LPXTG-motif cell wall-anchored protein
VVKTPTATGKLPLTGAEVLFQLSLGALALAGGALLFRRSSLA